VRAKPAPAFRFIAVSILFRRRFARAHAMSHGRYSNRANGREVHHILVGRVEPYWFAYRPTHINTGTCRNRSALIIVTRMEAKMPLWFFLPMIIASALLPAPRTAKPVREDD
jgi:hypothetical protein